MSDNYNDIMNEIKSNLTGDYETDLKYLKETSDKYKDHELGLEIIREIGRVMYSITPEEKKDDFIEAFSKDMEGLDAKLEEIRFNMYKKDFNNALKLVEELINKYEKMDLYHD